MKPDMLFELDIRPPFSVYIITGPLELLNKDGFPNEASLISISFAIKEKLKSGISQL